MEDAESLMDEILIEDPDCLFSLIDMAKLSQTTDFTKSLDHYLKALKLLEERSSKKTEGKKMEDIRFSDIVSPHLYNNIGVLCIKVGKFEEAKQHFAKAMKTLKYIRDKVIHHALLTHLIFNQGYLAEMTSDFGKATFSYKDVLKREPLYIDAYLRLAVLAKKRGNFDKAIRNGEQALKIDK